MTFKQLPLDEKEFTPIPIEKPSFAAKHPNLYGAYGAVKETGKTLSKVSFLKFIYPEERERFNKLAGVGEDTTPYKSNIGDDLGLPIGDTKTFFHAPKTKVQAQVRDLLLADLEAIALAAFNPIMKGLKPVVSESMKRWLPKTYAFWTKPRMAGSGTEAISKLGSKGAAKDAEKLPKYAGSVNLERQSITKEAKRLELEMFEQHGVKTSISHKEITKKAHGIVNQFREKPAFYAERIEAIKTGATPTIEEELAHRMINATEMDHFVAAAQGVAEGDISKTTLDALQTEMRDKFLNVVNPLASQAGRRLSSYNIEVGKHRAFKAIGELNKNLNPRQLKELANVNWDDAVSVDTFVKRLPDPKIKDYIYEYWYNSILSGIPTHVVNVTSNTLWGAFQIPHRALAGGIDKGVSMLTGAPRTRFMNEVIPMMGGMKTGAKRGAKAAFDMLRNGKLSEFETKWAQEMGAAVGAFERSPNKAVREVGKYLTIPTKALRAMDIMGNSIGYDAQLNALARRTSNLKKLSGVARKEAESAFRKSPPKWAHEEAMDFAKYSTFMDDPGFFSKGVIGIRDKVPGGRLVVPFVNTIGNLLKRGVEMTPGAGLALAKEQPLAEVMAKQIEGSILAYHVFLKAEKGELTGATPTEPSKRDAFYRQGKKAWSVKMGDSWYQYRRVEPFNTIIASAAIAHERILNAPDEDTATEIFGKVANDFKNNLIDSSYLQGVSQILNRHGKIKAMPQRVATSFVPFSGFFRSINRSYEAATEGSAKVRDTSDWLGAFGQVIPGLYKASPAKLDIWGKEIEREGGVFRQWLPYRWSTETTDPVEIGLETLGVYPGVPSKHVKIKGENVELDEDIYRDMVVGFGGRAKRYLDIQFSKPSWQKTLVDKKRHNKLIKILDSKISSYRTLFRMKATRDQRKRLQKQQRNP